MEIENSITWKRSLFMDFKIIAVKLIKFGVIGVILSALWAYAEYPSYPGTYKYFISFLTTGNVGAYTTGAVFLFWLSIVTVVGGTVLKGSGK